MKIKGLLLGMFACAALVACTNNDVVENNNTEQPEKVKANLTLSISTSTGSGRASMLKQEMMWKMEHPRKVVLKMLSLSLARFREIQRQD